jgi:hypothetical protein
MHARHLPDVLNPGRADNQRGTHRPIVGHGQVLAPLDLPRSSGNAGQPAAGMNLTQDHAGRLHGFTAFPAAAGEPAAARGGPGQGVSLHPGGARSSRSSGSKNQAAVASAGHGPAVGSAASSAGLSFPWCAIMPGVPLTPDEMLTTTRSVRKRLDLTRPVPLELVKECLEICRRRAAACGKAGTGSW